jgi:hypothetical protein
MDFHALLSSPSIRNQALAATFLHAEGANGAPHLTELLQSCQDIDSTKDLDRFEEALLGNGAMTMGHIVSAIGFDPQNTWHVSILRWIIQSTSSSNSNVAAHSIYGMGNLGVSNPETVGCLGCIVTSERRNNEHEHVSLRAIALRALRKINPEIAETFVDATAFKEYIHAVEYWLSTPPTMNDETRLELQNELEWLTRTRERRAMR